MAIATIEQFRKAIGEAPELTTPQTFRTEDGEVQRPFQVVEPEKNSHGEQGILEARLHPGSHSLVRVIYEPAYGLDVRKVLFLYEAKKGNRQQETLMAQGQISYKVGKVEIVSNLFFNSPFRPFEHQLHNLNEFRVSIGVYPASNPNSLPPLASVCYNYGNRIPIHAEFVDAEYVNALTGEFEQRRDPFSSQSSYLKTYFDWEYLVGAKVGHTRFKDNKSSYEEWLRWITKINNPEPTLLENTPYKAKISYSRDRGLAPLVGRLRFSRMNTKTGESWMLSVPELVDNEGFMRSLQSGLFRDFAWQYPVVFCVKQPGEARKWFSTFGKDDKAQ